MNGFLTDFQFGSEGLYWLMMVIFDGDHDSAVWIFVTLHTVFSFPPRGSNSANSVLEHFMPLFYRHPENLVPERLLQQ